MKVIEVVAAIIYKDGAYFTTQRGYGEFEGMWEFPGGKIEPGESSEDALKREIQEELGIDITIDEFLCTTNYDYPSFHLTMHCFICTLLSESVHLNEHVAAAWLTKDTLSTVKWLPADEGLIKRLHTIL